ncbi:hypothetical protein AOLI_G00322110 [Acnodon oligacanthus]
MSCQAGCAWRVAACKDHKHALEISQHAEDMGLILGACAGGLVVLILLLGAIVVIVKKGRDFYSYPYYPRKKVNMNKAAMTYRQEKNRKLGSLDCSTADQSTLQQDERTTHTFMDTHSCSARTEQRSSVNESSSLLGGSPRRHCRRKSSPYHTGQLHPAVRVADLLQHINQMKTAEGYGFKQEYESFFDGWDVTKKKDKTKGRHDTLLDHDRHRVKLHSLLADPNSDYVNANYIDIRINREGYQRSNHFIATQGAVSVSPQASSSFTRSRNHSQPAAEQQPCLQYWPETGMQQFGPMTVELLSRSTDDDVITRLFRVNNITRLQEGHLVVRHFQFLRWSAYRDIPDSKKAFLTLLAQVQKWQRECGEGRTVVHCLNGGGRSGTFCACTMIMEMVRHHSMVDVFYAVKTLRNSKPNMVETMEQYRFCYDLALEYLDCLEVR